VHEDLIFCGQKTRRRFLVAGDIHGFVDIPSDGEDKVWADANDDIGVALKRIAHFGIVEVPWP
jgi:hypothetical protein